MYFKSLFAAAASAALLMSCAKDTQIESALDTNNTIGFRSAITRGTPVLSSNLTEFFVSAFNGDVPYFLDLRFHKQNNGSEFNSDNSYFWPNNSTLKFFAYWPPVSSWTQGTTEWTATSKKLKEIVISPNISEHKDLIVAYAQGDKNTYQNKAVPLNFRHALSQIEIKAKNSSVYTYEVTGVRIGRPLGKGTLSNFENIQWNLVNNDRTDYSQTFPKMTLTPTAESVMGNGGNAMVFPQNLTPWNGTGEANGVYLALNIRIKTQSGAQIFPEAQDQYKWAAVSLSTPRWEPGKKYTYTLDFTNGAGKIAPNQPDAGKDIFGGPIKFTETVVAWSDIDGGTVDMQAPVPPVSRP